MTENDALSSFAVACTANVVCGIELVERVIFYKKEIVCGAEIEPL